MEGAGGKPEGMMGSGAREGTHLYCLDLIRQGDCWERHPLLERQAACQSVSVTPAGLAQWGGLAWHAVPCWRKLASYKDICISQISTVPSINTRLELIIISLQASSLPLTIVHKQAPFTASITHRLLSHWHINTHAHKLSLLVLSYYLTEHQQIFCSVPSSQWCEWLSRWI